LRVVSPRFQSPDDDVIHVTSRQRRSLSWQPSDHRFPRLGGGGGIFSRWSSIDDGDLRFSERALVDRLKLNLASATSFSADRRRRVSVTLMLLPSYCCLATADDVQTDNVKRSHPLTS